MCTQTELEPGDLAAGAPGPGQEGAAHRNRAEPFSYYVELTRKRGQKRRDITNQAVKMLGETSGDQQMRELSNFQGCANNLKMKMEVAARLYLKHNHSI